MTVNLSMRARYQQHADAWLGGLRPHARQYNPLVNSRLLDAP